MNLAAVACAVDFSLLNYELGYVEYEVASRVKQQSYGTDLLEELELLCQGTSTLHRKIRSPTEKPLEGISVLRGDCSRLCGGRGGFADRDTNHRRQLVFWPCVRNQFSSRVGSGYKPNAKQTTTINLALVSRNFPISKVVVLLYWTG